MARRQKTSNSSSAQRAATAGDAAPRRSRPKAQATRIDPLAMTVAQASKVLSAVSAEIVSEELIRRHIAAGAPVTKGQGRRGVRINVVHYGAWLNLPAGPNEGDDGP